MSNDTGIERGDMVADMGKALDQILAWHGVARRAWDNLTDVGEATTAMPDSAAAPPSLTDGIPEGLGNRSPALTEAPQTLLIPTERDVSAYYGQASARGEHLTWFSFPVPDVRLYSRTGERVRDRDGDGRPDHRCHKAVAGALETALRAVHETIGDRRYHEEGWHVYGGCHNYRPKTGGSSLSMHAWGIAIDLNPVENPFYSRATTFSIEAVEVMERFGFLWGPRAWGMPGYEGARAGMYVDAMHFQAAIPFLAPGSWYAKRGLPRGIERWVE